MRFLHMADLHLGKSMLQEAEKGYWFTERTVSGWAVKSNGDRAAGE